MGQREFECHQLDVNQETLLGDNTHVIDGQQPCVTKLRMVRRQNLGRKQFEVWNSQSLGHINTLPVKNTVTTKVWARIEEYE